MAWTATPNLDGWYWHRFYVADKPILNICYVRIADDAVYVHYLGEAHEQLFEPAEGVLYWGPLEAPPE